MERSVDERRRTDFCSFYLLDFTPTTSRRAQLSHRYLPIMTSRDIKQVNRRRVSTPSLRVVRRRSTLVRCELFFRAAPTRVNATPQIVFDAAQHSKIVYRFNRLRHLHDSSPTRKWTLSGSVHRKWSFIDRRVASDADLPPFVCGRVSTGQRAAAIITRRLRHAKSKTDHARWGSTSTSRCKVQCEIIVNRFRA